MTLLAAAGPAGRVRSPGPMTRLTRAVLRPIRAVFRTARARPVLSAACGLLLAALTAAGGVYLWAEAQLRAARAALEGDRLDEARRRVDRYLSVWDRNPSAHLLAARVKRRRWA